MPRCLRVVCLLRCLTAHALIKRISLLGASGCDGLNENGILVCQRRGLILLLGLTALCALVNRITARKTSGFYLFLERKAVLGCFLLDLLAIHANDCLIALVLKYLCLPLMAILALTVVNAAQATYVALKAIRQASDRIYGNLAHAVVAFTVNRIRISSIGYRTGLGILIENVRGNIGNIRGDRNRLHRLQKPPGSGGRGQQSCNRFRRYIDRFQI